MAVSWALRVDEEAVWRRRVGFGRELSEVAAELFETGGHSGVGELGTLCGVAEEVVEDVCGGFLEVAKPLDGHAFDVQPEQPAIARKKLERKKYAKKKKKKGRRKRKRRRKRR